MIGPPDTRPSRSDGPGNRAIDSEETEKTDSEPRSLSSASGPDDITVSVRPSPPAEPPRGNPDYFVAQRSCLGKSAKDPVTFKTLEPPAW
jgi:hypothetical protein